AKRGLELAVFLGEGLGADQDAPELGALGLELGVLAGGVPVIAGAADQPLKGRADFRQRAGYRRSGVERRAAHGRVAVWSDERQDQQDEAGDQSRDGRQEAEEEAILRPPRPAGAWSRRRGHPATLR